MGVRVRVRVRVSVNVSQWDSEKRYIGKATHSRCIYGTYTCKIFKKKKTLYSFFSAGAYNAPTIDRVCIACMDLSI